MPIILATQEVEVRRILIGSQFGQIVRETLSKKKKKKKKPSQKRAGGVAQGVGMSSNHSTAKKKGKRSH
jgi:hypothetical protein